MNIRNQSKKGERKIDRIHPENTEEVGIAKFPSREDSEQRREVEERSSRTQSLFTKVQDCILEKGAYAALPMIIVSLNFDRLYNLPNQERRYQWINALKIAGGFLGSMFFVRKCLGSSPLVPTTLLWGDGLVRSARSHDL